MPDERDRRRSPFQRGRSARLERPGRRGHVSGGLSEYVYGREAAAFNDLRREIASRLKTLVEDLGLPVLGGRAGMRATVVGASQYAAQVSGNTIYLADPGVLPLRNVPVVSPRLEMGDTIDPIEVAEALRAALENFELADSVVPLRSRWSGEGAEPSTA